MNRLKACAICASSSFPVTVNWRVRSPSPWAIFFSVASVSSQG
ncbi:Uncharacterised protein [Vibrio cholerae]|nr:Uncharacterised protein [Vibrio cholerae]